MSLKKAARLLGLSNGTSHRLVREKVLKPDAKTTGGIFLFDHKRIKREAAAIRAITHKTQL